MAFDLEDRFETVDGARPQATPLDEATAKRAPLVAFTVLRGGDVFEAAEARAPDDGMARARAYLDDRVTVKRHFTSSDIKERVLRELAEPLACNLALVERLRRAKPIVVDLVPPGRPFAKYGYPTNVAPSAAGLFWDHPTWGEARIAYRVETLDDEPTLVVHELAHAIHYLAFTKEERALVYQVLRPTFGSVSAMDEVFAIYSEREHCADFTEHERRAPGVYGITRKEWSEDHLFTRFVRKLYFPHKKLAGREAREREANRKWRSFSGG